MSDEVVKVLAYLTTGRKLSVFKHRDYPQAGVQVPAGTDMANESPAEAVIREVKEDTGLVDSQIVECLGRYNYDMHPYRDEIQERHVFHVRPASKRRVPDDWLYFEIHDGKGDPTAFLHYWLDLNDPALSLSVGQGALLQKLRESMFTVGDD